MDAWMTSWRLDPLVVVGLFGIGLVYVEATRRLKRIGAGLPRSRERCFLAGLVVVFLALDGPVDAGASALLSVHMFQHMLLTMIAAPLVVLGAPVTLTLRASSPATRTRILLPVLNSRLVRIAANPLVTWSLLFVVLWATHLTSLYEAAIQNRGLHALEHLAYLGSAVLFWWPVVGLDPIPARISHPARILYLFLAMPPMAFLGLAIYSSDHLLYTYYATVPGATITSALADQHLAGALMWEGGMFVVVPALAFVLLDWMRREERAADRADERAARAGRRQEPGTSVNV
ncbi:MAG: cytochrome c oxidase assembly protein [Actinobacteria bacterium]|nr:MAG: cytochrome c oxidase assembly protein [Actinomycetota bacterium]